QAVGRCHVRKHDRSDIAKIRIASCGRAASNSGNTAYDQCVAVLRDEPVFQTRTIKGTVARLCEKILARLTFELRMQLLPFWIHEIGRRTAPQQGSFLDQTKIAAILLVDGPRIQNRDLPLATMRHQVIYRWYHSESTRHTKRRTRLQEKTLHVDNEQCRTCS